MLALLFIALLGGTQICAAAGDLYVGQLSDDTIVRFPPSGGTQVTFAFGFFADSLAFDSKGKLFAADTEKNKIFAITPSGRRTTFASGVKVAGLAFDASGNLFASDVNTNSIYKYSFTGTRTTFATGLSGPFGLAFDRSGNLFVSQTDTGSILKFTRAGTRVTFASGLNTPEGLAFDGSGNLYEADFSSGQIFKFTPGGTKSTFASSLSGPRQIAFNRNGNLFVTNFVTQQIFKYTPNGTQSVFAAANSGGLAFGPMTSSPSPTPSPFPTPSPGPGASQLLNITTRVSVRTDQNVLIGGFIITGNAPKKVLLRAIGPSLSDANPPVPGALADPMLELHMPDGTLVTNDNWKDSQRFAVESTGIPPTRDKESAIVVTLAPRNPAIAGSGIYTAIMRGKNGGTGVGLVEVYDLDQSADSSLANISTRAFVDTGDNVMIGGFILGSGADGARVLIRALGPSVAVAGALPDPTLELYNANGDLTGANDNWKSDQQSAIEATGIPPQNNAESALIGQLPPGNYTAIVAGKNGSVGVGLVEVYALR